MGLVVAQKDVEQEKKKVVDLNDQYTDKARQLQKLQGLYDKLKRRTVIPAMGRHESGYASVSSDYEDSNRRLRPQHQPHSHQAHQFSLFQQDNHPQHHFDTRGLGSDHSSATPKPRLTTSFLARRQNHQPPQLFSRPATPFLNIHN